MGLILGYSIASMGPTLAFKQGAPSPSAPVVPNVPAAPSAPVAPTAAADLPEINPAEDHIIGPKNAKVTFVEYGDYECPFCIRHQATMKQLRDEYGDTVNFVYRHFPLDFHPTAMPKALAAECVGEIAGPEKFWEYGDAIMDRTQTSGQVFPTESLTSLAKELGVNEAEFTECYTEKRYQSKIEAQRQAAVAGGINGTPGNAIYNNETGEVKIVSGAQQFPAFKTIIDGYLK